jgi:hypothetical protein
LTIFFRLSILFLLLSCSGNDQDFIDDRAGLLDAEAREQ